MTVPTLWDTRTRRIVNNESSEIIRMMNSEFNAITGDTGDYYPQALHAEIDELNARIYETVNNGVYRCGFAQSQNAYNEAYDRLFATLDDLETRLSRRRYLVGSQITEADLRLFPTLVRFDVAYFSIFKCNKRRIADYPNLSNYMRDLYQVPGVAATVKPAYYVMGYYSRETQPERYHTAGHPSRFQSGPRPGTARGLIEVARHSFRIAQRDRSSSARPPRQRRVRTQVSEWRTMVQSPLKPRTSDPTLAPTRTKARRPEEG